MKSMHRTIRIAVTGLLLAIPAAKLPAQDHWPQFRGADARGVATGEHLPLHWSSEKNVAWTSDIPGRGWSSPVVWGDRVFLTTVVNLGQIEEPKKGLYFGGNRPDPPASTHQWKVFCVALDTGDILWERQVHEGAPATSIHLKNSFASETPVTDGEFVYCYFGNLGLYCFNFEGELIWSKPLEQHATRFGWGTAASPVLHKDRLYLVNDNEEQSYLLALDKRTGDELWRVPRDEKSNWSTPFIWENALRTEIVTAGTGKVQAYDLDGSPLWSLQGMSSITIATPFAYDGLLYISSGYVRDPLRPIYAIKPGASGDISLEADATSNEYIVWAQPLAGPYNPSTLAYQDRLYVLYDLGLLACYAADTGALIFDRQRLPDGRAFTASPWAYRDHIFCLNEDGVTYVVPAGDEFTVSHTNTLGTDEMFMATPAIAGNKLLIRSDRRLYCIAQLTEPETASPATR